MGWTDRATTVQGVIKDHKGASAMTSRSVCRRVTITLPGLCRRLTCLMPQWQYGWEGGEMGVFAGRGVWNPLINVTCLWSKENTQMTSESGGALGNLGDVPHPGMLGLGVRLQLPVILHILPETKMSRGSALLLRASLLQSFLHVGLPQFSENMCGPGGIFCARSGASGPLPVPIPVPTDGPRGPCLTTCCCAVHSSTLDWGRRTRLFLSPSTTWGSPKHSTCYSSISSHTLRTDCGVIGSRRAERKDFVDHNYIPFFSLFKRLLTASHARRWFWGFFSVAPCATRIAYVVTESQFPKLCHWNTWGRLTDMSR